MVEVRLQRLGLDPETRIPMVILQESEGDRILPIWIGPAEASAIAVYLANCHFQRPLTHDLLVALVKDMGAVLDEVHITRVEDGTYYAELILLRNEEVIRVDARPSDSIALALRAQARILASDDLLEWNTVDLLESEFLVDPELFEEDADPSQPRSGPMNPEELESYLRTLNPEDFGRFTP